MPTYTIRDTQTGRTMKVRGDAPPSDADIDELFQVNAPKQRSIGGFLGNVVNSGGRAIGETVSGIANIFNPNMEQNTVANLARLGGDSIGALFGNRDESNRAIQLINYYKNRYGKDLGNTLYEDPVGVLLDASSVLGGTGALLKGAGTAGKVNALTRAGQVASRAGSVIDPINAVGRGIGKAVKKVTPSRQTIAEKLRKGSEGIVTRGLGNPATQDKFLRKGRTTADDIFERYNLYDRDPETAKAANLERKKLYDSKALDSSKTVSLNKILADVDNEIYKLENGADRFSDSSLAMINELKRRKGQLLEYVGATDNSTPLTGVNKITEYRMALDKDIPQSQFGLDAKGTGTAQGAKKIRDFLRKTINSTDPELERLGLDYGVLKGYEDVFSKSQSRADNRQLINIKSLLAGGFGNALAGVPGMITAAAVDVASNNPQVLKGVSKGMKGAGDFVEKASMPKVPKNVFRGLNAAYNTGKADRLLNQSDSSKSESIPKPIMGESLPQEVQQPQISNTSQSRPSYAPAKVTVNIPKKKKQAFSGKVTLKKSNAS